MGIKDKGAREVKGRGVGLATAGRHGGNLVFEPVLTGPVFVSLLVQF